MQFFSSYLRAEERKSKDNAIINRYKKRDNKKYRMSPSWDLRLIFFTARGFMQQKFICKNIPLMSMWEREKYKMCLSVGHKSWPQWGKDHKSVSSYHHTYIVYISWNKKAHAKRNTQQRRKPLRPINPEVKYSSTRKERHEDGYLPVAV